MLIVPVDASVMPVPEPVDPVSIVTSGSFPLESVNCFWYAAVQAPINGYSSELPVSVMVVAVLSGDAGSAAPTIFAAAGELELLLGLPLELQAAAKTESGTRAAAVNARRVLLATGEYSFISAR